MLDGLPEHEDEWLGFRPTLPDFLPVIGPSKIIKMFLFFWPPSFRLDSWSYIWKNNLKNDCRR